jgi:hypothetical protein
MIALIYSTWIIATICAFVVFSWSRHFKSERRLEIMAASFRIVGWRYTYRAKVGFEAIVEQCGTLVAQTQQKTQAARYVRCQRTGSYFRRQ